MKTRILTVLLTAGVAFSSFAEMADNGEIEKEKQRIEREIELEKRAIDRKKQQLDRQFEREKQQLERKKRKMQRNLERQQHKQAELRSKPEPKHSDGQDVDLKDIVVEIAPQTRSHSTIELFGLSLVPNIALGTTVTSSVRQGKKLTIYTGLIGVTILGTPQQNFVGGWANSFLFESYAHKNVYGIFTGLNGHLKDSYGIMISVLNRTRGSYGLQLAALNAVSQSGGGLSIALQNEASSYCGVQAGLLNAVGRLKTASDDFGFAAQIGGSNINNRKQDFSIQIGIFNSSQGGAFQIGLLNHSPNAWIPWFPILNFSLVPSAEKTEP